MKKILLTLTVLFGLSVSTYAQNWEELYSNNKILVETTVMDCNPNNNQYPFSYLIFKYTNKTSSEITFEFKFEKWYNDVLFVYGPAETSSENETKTISLAPNEIREANCNLNDEKYKMFYKNNHPKIDHKLSQVNIIEIQTK